MVVLWKVLTPPSDVQWRERMFLVLTCLQDVQVLPVNIETEIPQIPSCDHKKVTESVVGDRWVSATPTPARQRVGRQTRT